MIVIRSPESIFQAHSTIQNGTFQGRWHFSFDQYDDPEHTNFGASMSWRAGRLPWEASLCRLWPRP